MGKRVLVTGASGLIGRHLVRQLLTRGDEPIIFSRRHSIPSLETTRIEIREGDLRRPESVAAATRGCDVIIHAAGEVFDRQQMKTTNVDGMKNLLSLLPREVQQLIVVSSIGVIGAVSDAQVSENSPCHPENEYETTKLEAEMLALEFGRTGAVRVAALRPTNVFGERENVGRPDSFAALLRVIDKGRFVYFGRSASANYVYAGDVAAACISAMESDVTGVVHINDPCSLEQFVSAAADALGVRRPSIRVPKAIAYSLASALQVAGAITRRRPPLTMNRVRALTSRTIYVSNRIPREMPWQPPYGYAEGLKRTVAHYRKIGLL